MRLQGKVFISTVSSGRSLEIRNIFEPLGTTVIDFPMTEVKTAEQTPAVQNAISEIEQFNWIIFTSINGVIHFHKLFRQARNFPGIPSSIKIAVVGSKTALELEKTGRKADYSGRGNTAENLINEIIEIESVKNCNILLPLGNLAPDTMEKRFSKISDVTRINVYNTIKSDIYNYEPIERIKSDSYDLVLFTSPSGVSNFIDAIGKAKEGSEIRAAAIGQVTSRAAVRSGLNCLVTASVSTYEGLANEIVNYYTINK